MSNHLKSQQITTIIITTLVTIGILATTFYYQRTSKEKSDDDSKTKTTTEKKVIGESKEVKKEEACCGNNDDEGCCNTTNNNTEEEEGGGCCSNNNEEDNTSCCGGSKEDKEEKNKILAPGSIIICYTSITGTCEKLAQELYSMLLLQQQEETNSDKKIHLQLIQSIDWWDEFSNYSNNSASTTTVIFLLPTWTNGTCPPNTEQLLSSLEDISHDWRMEKFPLSGLQIGIWGMGSTAYDMKTFCKPANDLFRLLKALGGSVLEVGFGDDADTNWEHGWNLWNAKLITKLSKKKNLNDNDASENASSQQPVINDYEDYDDSDSDDSEEDEPTVEDVEDMLLNNEEKKESEASSEPKEMVTPKQAKALKKEGYQLIGSHSAVKLCRWTKHQLRGRGGCYKHTFYGITSYQCMEATPSLACANKCVFCWRHHKNPVAKTWQWKMDEPDFIVQTGIRLHLQLIKQAKGIPGVLPERFLEAQTVRHCALSLVGEPIMYPKINQLLYELHKRRISTFLVTNGQHPEAIKSLTSPVTQLYVSIDAPNSKQLIEIDRPLFNDAWERLRESLVALKERKQRTVARLTIVKGFNEDDIQGYAELISLGLCHLVEIKGVTYCGKSGGSNLNMSNSPWHHEIISFAQAVRTQLNTLPNVPKYGIACEHKHSCSVLLAREDLFLIDNQWHTWIDYDAFNGLVMKTYDNADDDGNNADTAAFEASQYIQPTPSWGVFGNAQDGFDPVDKRHYRKQMKYTFFDGIGVPTHDHDEKELPKEEYLRLKGIMEVKKRELGGVDCTVEIDIKKGEKNIVDVRNMFRGETMPKK